MSRVLVMGAGYVGLAHALLFTSQPEHHVVLADIDTEKISLINQGISPLQDEEMMLALAEKPSNLHAVLADQVSYDQFDVVFLCLPTNYDEEKEQFDTSILDQALATIIENVTEIPIVIKSTLPIGYTLGKIETLHYPHLIFSPEFLREGQALRDNLYPTRLVIGTVLEDPQFLANLYQTVVRTPEVPVLIMSPTEAESVKLFANTYLAMRVAFFNELDTFSELHELNSKSIIKGLGLDERIGRFYNNPSFGYGGYCLPKDSKQLRSNFEGIPADLIGAIVTSNDRRKQFIADRILDLPAQAIGIYRLAMKHDSDNSRESAILDIMKHLQAQGRRIIIFEPHLATNSLPEGMEVVADLALFKAQVDCIVANRWHADLTDVKDKVYTRDIFQMD